MGFAFKPGGISVHPDGCLVEDVLNKNAIVRVIELIDEVIATSSAKSITIGVTGPDNVAASLSPTFKGKKFVEVANVKCALSRWTKKYRDKNNVALQELIISENARLKAQDMQKRLKGKAGKNVEGKGSEKDVEHKGHKKEKNKKEAENSNKTREDSKVEAKEEMSTTGAGIMGMVHTASGNNQGEGGKDKTKQKNNEKEKKRDKDKKNEGNSPLEKKDRKIKGKTNGMSSFKEKKSELQTKEEDIKHGLVIVAACNAMSAKNLANRNNSLNAATAATACLFLEQKITHHYLEKGNISCEVSLSSGGAGTSAAKFNYLYVVVDPEMIYPQIDVLMNEDYRHCVTCKLTLLQCCELQEKFDEVKKDVADPEFSSLTNANSWLDNHREVCETCGLSSRECRNISESNQKCCLLEDDLGHKQWAKCHHICIKCSLSEEGCLENENKFDGGRSYAENGGEFKRWVRNHFDECPYCDKNVLECAESYDKYDDLLKNYSKYQREIDDYFEKHMYVYNLDNPILQSHPTWNGELECGSDSCDIERSNWEGSDESFLLQHYNSSCEWSEITGSE